MDTEAYDIAYHVQDLEQRVERLEYPVGAAPDPTTRSVESPLTTEALTQMIATWLVGWADAAKDKSRYPIPTWADSERLALQVQDALAARLEADEQQIEGKDKLLRRWLPQRTGGEQK